MNLGIVTDEVISSIAGRVVEAIHPVKIILFVFRTWGKPGSLNHVVAHALREGRDLYVRP